MSDHKSHGEDEEEHHAGSHHAEEHGEGGHGEPWLVSYADLMTLLFGFFVLMYSFESAKNQDDASMVRMRKELSQYFGGSYVDPLTDVAKKFQEKIVAIDGIKDVTVRVTPEGLEITFQSTVLFDLGRAELTSRAQSLMQPLVSLLKETHSNYKIKVEGYTDDLPIKSDRYPSNWELSGARAATVLRLFETAGFDPNKLTALGYGSTRPAFPNRSPSGEAIPQNQARNRRVVILVTNELEDPKKTNPHKEPAK
jgi:chemotaxis protein MotB